jgi:hypothetical protein
VKQYNVPEYVDLYDELETWPMIEEGGNTEDKAEVLTLRTG